MQPQKYREILEKIIPGTPAAFSDFPPAVDPAVQALLLKGGRRPYSHQAQVASLMLEEHQNVMLVTRVASGKTLAFLSVVLSILAKDPEATALLVYPLNALATDQLRNLEDLGFSDDGSGLLGMNLGESRITLGVLNGETPADTKTRIRRSARVILTNPSEIHFGMLSFANWAYADGTSWRRFFKNLQIVVLDEAHSQNGVEGSHTAMILRRTLALTETLSGSVPRCLLASATIGNPVEHAEALTGLSGWVLVNRSGAQSYDRTVRVLAPRIHPRGGKWNASVVTREIALQELTAGRRILIFCGALCVGTRPIGVHATFQRRKH